MDCEQKLRIAIEALQQYAIAANWGDTSSFGHKIRNRFLVKGHGNMIACEALAAIEVEMPAIADPEAPQDEVIQQLDQLLEVQESSGWKPGWVVHQVVEKGLTSKMNFDDWVYLAEKLDYTKGWAYLKHEEFSK